MAAALLFASATVATWAGLFCRLEGHLSVPFYFLAVAVCGLVVLEVEEMSLTEVARSRRGEWDVDKKRVCDCMLLYFLAVAETRAGRFAGWRLTTPRPVTRRRVARLGWNGGWRPGTCT